MSTTVAHPTHTAIARWRATQHPIERLRALLLAAETMVRVDALVLASIYIRSNAARVGVRQMLLSTKFLFSDWCVLLRELVASDPSGERQDLRRWYYEMDRSAAGRPLWSLIELRNREAHDLGRLAPDFVDEALRQGEALLSRCLESHPDFGSFEDARGVILHQSREGALRCDPLLYSGSAIGQSGALLLYAGAASNRLSFESLDGGEYRSRDAFNEVRQSLERKLPTTQVLDSRCPPDLLQERLFTLSNGTVRRVVGQRRYRPEVTIDRAELDSEFVSFLESDDQLMLLEGLEGAGKTTWLCRMTERRIGTNCAVLLETADRLPSGDWPDILGTLVRTSGQIPESLETLSASSHDSQVVIAIDDLGASGEVEGSLNSLFRWVDQLPPDSAIRVVASVRSDRLRRYQQRHAAAMPVRTRGPRMVPALSEYEIALLAAKMPSAQTASDEESAHALRRECATRIAESGQFASRRPGLAVPMLERALAGGGSQLVVPDLYQQILARDVLEVREDGRPAYPLRVELLRTLATSLLRRNVTELAFDDDDAVTSRLVDPRTGDRTVDYEAVLSAGVLNERMDDLRSFVSFSDTRLFAYVAASALSLEEPHTEIQRTSLGSGFSLGPTISAFYLIRVARLKTPAAAAEAVGSWTDAVALLTEVACLDCGTFERILSEYSRLNPDVSETVVTLLMDSGEPRLGLRAASVLLANRTLGKEWSERVRMLKIRGHYELDEYQAALDEISQSTPNKELRRWRAELLSAMGRFEQARTAWLELLAEHDGQDRVGRAVDLSGLGYVLTQLGHHEGAESSLREALIDLEDGPVRHYAEALGQLGELLTRGGQHLEAREVLERNRQVVARAGLFVGAGVVLGLIGEVDLNECRLEDAETGLTRALDIHRRCGNRWREAWTLTRLARVHQARGRAARAEEAGSTARAIFVSLGVAT